MANPKKPKQKNTSGFKEKVPPAWVFAIIICIITYVVFSPSLKCEFTNWDDLDYVLESRMIKSDSIQYTQIFTTPVSLNYHPLTMLTFAWNYKAGQLDPWGYHLVNLLLHIFNTLLAFLFIFRLTNRNLLVASVVSLFFGIHPMHVESVTWISERKDVMYVFFFLSALLAYMRYRRTNALVWYLLSLTAFLLSCLSKGMAVVLPVVLLLIDYYQGTKIDRISLIEKIPFFLMGALFGVLAFFIQNSGGVTVAMENFSAFQRLMFASYGLLIYIVKLFVPYKLAAFHPYPLVNKEDVLPVIFYVYPFIVLLGAALLFFFFRKTKAVVFGLLFYLITVAMVLQFVSVGFAIIADRYTYLSYLGLMFVFASVLDAAWQNKNKILSALKYPLAFISVAGALAFSSITYQRTQVWNNSETLWNDEISKYPKVDRSYWHRGIYYQALNKNDEALKDFNKALEINPFYGAAYNSRAKLYFVMEKYDLSLADCYQAIQFDSLDKGTLINCGIIFRTLHKFDDAGKYFAKAYDIDRNNPGLYINRGIYYDMLGEDEKALADFDKYIKLFPTRDENAYNYRGVSFSKLNRHPEAIADFTTSIQINSSNPTFYTNRSISEFKIGNLYDARADVMKARDLGAQIDTSYLNSLGIK